MKKYTIIILTIFCVLLLSWCGKKTTQNIDFERYTIVLKTKYQYQEIKNTTTNEELNTIKQFIQTNTSWFIGSILIGKNEVNTWIDLKKIWEKNKKIILKNIPWTKESSKNFSFTCSWEKLSGILQKFSTKWTKTTKYLNQIFFIQDNEIYWISTMTEDKKENSNFKNIYKTIECLPTK